MPFFNKSAISRALFLSSLLTFLLPATSFSFSENRLRVEKFKWMHVQTEHFDIYFDKKTELLVPRMAHYLEKAWKEVGETFRFQVPGRTPFFFYSNHNQFEQTNIVPIGEGTGGVTEAFKNRFVIFNDGSEEWMKHVIYHEFSHVVQFNILYGGFWKSIRLLKSPFYPLWGMEGSAEHGSGEIDGPTGDMVVRDAVAHKILPPLQELQGFGHLKPNQITLGYKTGEAAFEFMEAEFGKEKLQEFLFVMKDHFDVSSALETLLGCDLNQFNFRFNEWLQEKYTPFFREAQFATSYGEQLTNSDSIPQSNEAPVISAEANKMYYFSDRGGPTQLYEYDFLSKKEQPLLGLKWKSFENIHTRGRALSISRDSQWLAFAGEKKQKDFLYLYDLHKNHLKRVRVPFDEMRSPVFSPIDDRLVCVGMTNGFNDLYLINTKGDIQDRLTNSSQDERDPVFSRDGASIVFSGEVLSEDQSEPAGRNIFSLDLNTKKISQKTNDAGSEIEPETLPDGTIIFTQDRDAEGNYGFNLAMISPKSTGTVPLTHLIGGGFSPRYTEKIGSLAFVGFEQGEKHIYQGYWDFESSVSTEPVVINQDNLEESDAPLLASHPQPGWPFNSESSLFNGAAKPYRLKGSTDLFIPFFFYSTQEGLALVNIWQFSDMFGNHQLQQQMQYASGDDLFDLSLFYTYARFRPQFSLGFRGQKFFRDFEKEKQRRETNVIGLVTYPFDRVFSAQAGVGVTDRKDAFLDESEDNTIFKDRFSLLAFSYDTVTGRYLVPTKGRRLNLFYQQGFETLRGDQEYKTGGLEAVQYIPFPMESTWASRFFYGRSVGEDAQVFRLGGVDRIRALPGRIEENKKSNIAFASTEFRLRLKYLNARTAFLFPDFFFKAAYLIVFDDVGYGWNNTFERKEFETQKLNNSAGVGLSWPTFILQSFQLNLTVQWARQTNEGNDVWYITLAPSF